MLPFTLAASKSVVLSGLVDTGAALNVLPFSVGLSLGFDWDQQTTSIQLSGNLARVEARVTVASATIGGFGPVRMAFAWTRDDAVPVILGQVNSSWSLTCVSFGRGGSSRCGERSGRSWLHLMTVTSWVQVLINLPSTPHSSRVSVE